MNIKYLQELLSKIDEIKIIGKNAKLEGSIFNVAALVRDGLQLHLIILEHDEDFQEQWEQKEQAKEMEISEISEIPPVLETNRMLMKGSNRVNAFHPFMAVENVFVGNNEFEVSGAENRQLNMQDGESIIFLSELLRNGWNPEGVDYQNIDMLFLTNIELRGNYEKIPEFENKPSLHFTMGRDTTSCTVEKPVILTVNGKYSEKLWFNDKETGEEHWVRINRVYLSDVWADVEKIYSNPVILNQMTKEQISAAKKSFEEDFIKICPKGMCFPIVEYECDDDISLEFYTVKYLDAASVSTNGSIGFIVNPHDETGILGAKLKSAVIQEPMNQDKDIIEAELFMYHKTTVLDDIII